MSYELIRIAYLFSPMLMGGIFHGLCLRNDWLHWMAVPVDRGAQWRGRPLFGPNKTWRGIITVAVGAAATVAVQARVLHRVSGLADLEYFDYSGGTTECIGLAFGFCAQLSELPNSFLKRRLDISPGKGASGFWKPLFYLLDQIDLLAGSWLVLGFFVPITLLRLALSIILILLVHQLLSLAGYFLGMRKSIR